MGAAVPPHPRPDPAPTQQAGPDRHRRPLRERDSMNTPPYLDIHALQTLPYSNVNRDDLGLPKVLAYGGAERTRVSSQSWKRAVRHQVETKLADPAVRTRRIIGAVAERL